MFQKLSTSAFILFCIIVTSTQLYMVTHKHAPIAQPVTVGDAGPVILPNYPTIANPWIGTADTVVVATSTGRLRLEITNLSGATSTPQALYCNVGDRPAVKFSGIVIQASTTKTFDLNSMTRTAIHCLYPTAASSVSVIDW